MQIDYNKFTESELRVILEAARTINFAFGTQFPSMKEQMALLIEDFQFRDPDAPDFVPDRLEK